jgi:hypothetical protein
MATEAQIAANRANAQRSTGPRTEAGKQAVAQNRLEHGLSGGAFRLLPWESAEEFEALQAGLRAEHQPETVTEQLLVDRLAEHEWLRRRAGYLQSLCASADGIIEDARQFALYLRYQTTHQRAFHKCLQDLLKLRAEKRKAQIGFESQQRRERQQAEQAELRQARIRLVNAKAAQLELDTEIRSLIEARLPGHQAIPFDQLKPVLSLALEEVFGKRTPITKDHLAAA